MRGLNVAAEIRRQDVALFLLALPAAAVSGWVLWRAADPTWRLPALIAVTLIHLGLLVRHGLPWVTLAVTGLGLLPLVGHPLISATVTGLPGPLPAVLLPSAAMFLLAVYSVAAHAVANRWLAVVLGVAVAAQVTAALWIGLPWLLRPVVPEAWRAAVGLGLVVGVVCAFALGRWRALALRSGDLGTRWIEAADARDAMQVDAVITQQQTRLARETQRAVAWHLDGILERAREGRAAARRVPAIADDALAEIEQQGEAALGRVQTLLALLDRDDTAASDEADGHEDRVESGGVAVLAPEDELAVQPQLADLPKVIAAARDQGLSVALEVEGERGDLPVAAQLALYRTVQEALTNTVRHAGPGALARVDLVWDEDEVAVIVEDEVLLEDGSDWPDRFAGGEVVEGDGLRTVRERLETLGGHLEVEPLADGFRVRAVVPRGPMPLPV